jgi:hypothetical protein
MVGGETLVWDCINGGNVSRLTTYKNTDYGVILWMPNIDNKHEKILPDIKKLYPTVTLISTKATVGRDFSDWDMVGRLLQSHSNLGIMISLTVD